LHRNCLLKHIIEGKVEGGIEVTRREGRRNKQLLNDTKGNERILEIEEEALDCPVWGTCFGRGCGPVARLTM
jgi:hypothetical protein